MNPCVITLQASQDLDEISEYFVSRNVEAGEKLLQLFNEKCARLMQFPNMGKSYAHIRSWLRGVPLNNYIIFYEVLDDEIIILRILGGQQDLPTLLKDDQS
jgi:toxin ParE1/3/4